MRGSPSIVALLTLGAGACVVREAPSADTDRWADTMVPASAVPPLEVDDDWEEEDEWYWVGYGDPSPGESFTGAGEVFIGTEALEVCIVLYRYVASEPLDDCPGCDFAYALTLGEIDVELDAGGRESGLDPEALEGMTQTIGYAGEEWLLTKVNGTWIVGGEVFSDEHDFEFEMPFVPLVETEEAP